MNKVVGVLEVEKNHGLTMACSGRRYAPPLMPDVMPQNERRKL